MRTLNLSGFKQGDSLSISVSQGALTAGPYSVGSWGGGGTGGTVTINVHRNTLHVAPSSVRFSVDLSLSNFDTAGPTGDATYDARLHDLIYLWDFDDPGTWTAPVQNLAAHKNRNAGKGPIEANMYRTPGTYNPSVLVIEPSSGKTATASVSVVVTDPDVVFAGNKTICINPVGDNDFAGAPTGSLHYQVAQFGNSIPAWRDNFSTTEVRRFLFKGGETHVVNMLLGTEAAAGAWFGSYGNDQAVLITERRTTITDVLYDNHLFTSRWAIKNDSEYWFVNLEAAGNFDPTTTIPLNSSGYDATFLRYADTGYITICDCYIHNMLGTAITTGAPISGASDYKSGIQVAHIDNTIVHNCGGVQYQVYQAWGRDYASSWFVVSGTRVEMHPDTLDADIIRGCVRINDARNQIVKGCDIFNTEKDNTAVKLIETPKGHGCAANCHGNAIEGQLSTIFVNGNKTQTLTQGVMSTNSVIDGNLLCGGHSTQGICTFYGTGITVRNNLMYLPDQQPPDRRFTAAFMFKVRADGGVGVDVPDHVFEAPIRIYNNTFLNERTATNNNDAIFGSPTFINTNEWNVACPTPITENNVIHQPYTAVPVTTYAPLSNTVIFTPRSTNWVNAQGFDSEPIPTSHPEAGATTSVKDTKPLPGSAALGAALSGNVSYMDILGTTRSAPADKGAWEA